ncbi:MAG TPA: hypothetical protein VMW13_08535 [Dehalococcoidales bacterium]|nr:hypothetical protein [Dehalococcoidales bacterium]
MEIASSLLRSARDILGSKDMILRPFRTIPFLLVFVAILLAVMLILVGAEPTEAG